MEKTDTALSKILTTLADKFGTTVSHLYAIMIRQAYIDGFENLFILLFICVIAGVFYRFLHRDYKNENEWCNSWGEYFEENVGMTVITIVLCLILSIGAIATIIGSMDCFANPEYYALHQILKHD